MDPLCDWAQHDQVGIALGPGKHDVLDQPNTVSKPESTTGDNRVFDGFNSICLAGVNGYGEELRGEIVKCNLVP